MKKYYGRKKCCAKGGASLADEERGAAKPRGRGRGRRNINGWLFEHSVLIFLLVIIYLTIMKPEIHNLFQNIEKFFLTIKKILPLKRKVAII